MFSVICENNHRDVICFVDLLLHSIIRREEIMAAYLQFIGGDFGKTKYVYKGRNSLSRNNIFSPSLSLTDIASCEEQGAGENVKKAGGTVGGAIIGGVLTGGIGAVVGGMAGGNQVETTVIITTRDGRQGIARANAPMMDAIRGYLFELDHPQKPMPENKLKVTLRKVAAVIMILLGVSVAMGGFTTLSEKKDSPDMAAVIIVFALGILLIYGGIRFWRKSKSSPKKSQE